LSRRKRMMRSSRNCCRCREGKRATQLKSKALHKPEEKFTIDAVPPLQQPHLNTWVPVNTWKQTYGWMVVSPGLGAAKSRNVLDIRSHGGDWTIIMQFFVTVLPFSFVTQAVKIVMVGYLGFVKCTYLHWICRIWKHLSHTFCRWRYGLFLFICLLKFANLFCNGDGTISFPLVLKEKLSCVQCMNCNAVWSWKSEADAFQENFACWKSESDAVQVALLDHWRNALHEQ
jgi:hypothetical protein